MQGMPGGQFPGMPQAPGGQYPGMPQAPGGPPMPGYPGQPGGPPGMPQQRAQRLDPAMMPSVVSVLSFSLVVFCSMFSVSKNRFSLRFNCKRMISSVVVSSPRDSHTQRLLLYRPRHSSHKIKVRFHVPKDFSLTNNGEECNL